MPLYQISFFNLRTNHNQRLNDRQRGNKRRGVVRGEPRNKQQDGPANQSPHFECFSGFARLYLPRKVYEDNHCPFLKIVGQ